MTLTRLLFWISLGGMAAGVYHQNLPLTIAFAAGFLGAVQIISVPIITVFNETPNKEDK